MYLLQPINCLVCIFAISYLLPCSIETPARGLMPLPSSDGPLLGLLLHLLPPAPAGPIRGLRLLPSPPRLASVIGIGG